jgi:hypothetical protein
MEVIADQRLPGASIAHADTKIIPSISASERYDSNVFISPSSFIPAGKQKWDLVTSVVPQVDVLTTGRHIVADVYAGLSGNVFVYNSALNFISVNAGGVMNLDGFVGQYIRGLKLQVADTFFYTPEPPSFITGVKAGVTQDPFATGIVAFRANTYTNNATITGDYALSRTVSILGTYNNSIFRVGQIFATQTTQTGAVPISFFDTMYQNWTIGPAVRLSRSDAVTMTYQRTTSDLSGVGTEVHFAANGLAAEYTKTTQDWTARISGGATILEQTGVTFFSGQLSFSGMIDPSTRTRISIRRQIAPAYFGTGVAYISTAGSAAIERRLSKVLTLTGNVSYGFNEATPVKVVTLHSFAGSVGMKYAVTRTVSALLSYNYTHFRINEPLDVDLLTDRSFVMFTITASWK